MTETMTREERLNALDQFAQLTPEDRAAALPAPVAQTQMQVVGAQPVAVRRDISRVLQEIRVLAAAAGEDWYYRFPVKNRKTGRTDYIEGPSIKLANDVARIYGNCEVDCRGQDMGNAFLFHARILDIETGFALTRPFQQRKGAAKIGGDDDARREEIAYSIGTSKAIRNVVVNALQTYADFAFEEAKSALVSKIGGDLPRWRSRVAERLGAKIDVKRVEAVIGRSFDEMLAPDIAKVVAMGKACEDGMSSWDETFPPLHVAPVEGVVLDRFIEQQTTEATNPAEVQTVEAPQDTTTEGVSTVDPDEAAAVYRLKAAAVDLCMRIATNPQLTVEQRLAKLDDTVPALDGVTEALGKTIAKTAAEVASGKLKQADARRYLGSILK